MMNIRCGHMNVSFISALKAFALFCCVWSCHLSSAQAASPGKIATLPEKHLAVFQKYCFECHDSATQEGRVDLESLSFEISRDIPTAEQWQKVLAAINAGEMPPADSDPITDHDKAEFLRDLSVQMVAARDILSDSGGMITMRRLNRREYQNTLEALLGFRPDVSSLPGDDGAAKFDTFGGSLFFSSDQFERYRETATRTLQAVLTPHEKAESKIRRVEPEETVSTGFFEQAEQMVLNKKTAEDFLALPEGEQNEAVAKTYGLKDIEHARRIVGRFAKGFREVQDYIQRPEAKTGAVMVHTKNRTPGISTPKIDDLSGGTYILRIRAGYYEDSPLRERYLEYGFSPGTVKTSRVLGQVKVTGTVSEPAILEIPLELPLGTPGRYVVRQRDYEEKASRRFANQAAAKENGIGQPPSTWIDYIEIEGPFHDVWPNPVQAELMPPHETGENEGAYANRVIARFAASAFRGKEPDRVFIDKLVARYLAKRASGVEQHNALIDVYALMLASPSFVYLSEPREGNAPVRLTDRELAIGLSYFLWSAPPDEELFALAGADRLSDPQVLREQTSRLLDDDRSEAFISGFAHQWLEMKRLDMFEFSAMYHPEFDEAIRRSVRGEIYATIRHLIDEKLPLQKLLDADFVLANDVLADYYNLPGVEGAEFRKVSLPENSPRGGLLGAAAIHIMGSDGQRSSPVERGAWVLRHLLNDPPPPAPANVPMLSRFDGKVLAVRDLQKAHQEQPQCAQCHQKIDPIGFGLESFTAAGLWRNVEVIAAPEDALVQGESAKKKKRKKKGAEPEEFVFPIEASGKLLSGETFEDYFGLRDLVATHDKAFARGFTENLVAYALGRPFAISDHNLATEITAQAVTQGNTIEAFIQTLVQSKAFHMK
ncbi:Planctomycete cytochrome C [Neorhodopirellula lusitana]|uniref:Planctomycete cytochrome C n=1 Tax=Neorhodopirellula lusitana TaxID=445327 RepID=A0ABY1PSN9_9BACT|nr:DUF1592 domain-containing protein [Neorhodopirellula lusitana]SMP42884.1 Planctomycete cytochrome C [Neorhodopirellula lusitana]